MSLYDELFRFEALNQIFSDEATLQGMLDFEVALARAEASAGLIPEKAAGVIARNCTSKGFSIRELSQQAAHAGNFAIPLVKQLTQYVSEEEQDAARYVHWGATSQDVVDTGMVLQLRRALALMQADLDRAVSTLAALTEKHRSAPVAARTWMQQALPTTFGFIAAGWLDALLRHRARLREIEPRVLTLHFGGAAGTLAALGDDGAKVAKALAQDLKLSLPAIPQHTHRDSLAELATTCALLAGTLGKIARDISLHTQTEIAELAEPAAEGRGGSSTLPHKRNPVTCAVVLAAAQRVPGLAATILSAMPQEHQRGLGGWHAEWETLPELVGLTAGALHHLGAMLPGLAVDTARMRKNLDATNGLIYSEGVAMALAEHLGKQPAHALVESACKKAVAEQRHLKDILASDAALRGKLSPADLDKLFDPARYLGSAQIFINAVLDQARATAAATR